MLRTTKLTIVLHEMRQNNDIYECLLKCQQLIKRYLGISPASLYFCIYLKLKQTVLLSVLQNNRKCKSD